MTSASTTSGGRSWIRSTSTPSLATACRRRSGRSSSSRWTPPSRTGTERPGDLGGPRRAAALHFFESHVLGRPRPRHPAGTTARRPPLAEEWQLAADAIHPDICENAVDERGVLTQHYDTDALDASCLLLPLLRFLPADDPRIRATVLAIADEFTDEGLVLRYRADETDDGLEWRRRKLHDLFLLAGQRAGRDRRARPGPPTLRTTAGLRQLASAATQKRSIPGQGAISETSPRPSPTSP